MLVESLRPGSLRIASALLLAALAALLASSCCLLPLLLVLVGVSGAWIAQLTLLQAYSPCLEALAVAALCVAAWRIYRPALRSSRSGVSTGAPSCEVDASVSCRVPSPAARRWFWTVAALTLLPIVFPVVAPLFY
jgi:mercuric ion transport protein